MTLDETWVHSFYPDSKSQSKQWKHSGSPLPKKFKLVASVGKMMASVFWDCVGMLMIDFLQKGQTIDYNKNNNNNNKKKRKALISQSVAAGQCSSPHSTSGNGRC